MTPPVFATAYASAAVKAALGTTPCRLYSFGEAPEGVALPYATWQLVTGRPENYLGEVPDVDSFTVQVDVFASTGASATSTAQTLRDAFEPVAHVTRWGWGAGGRDPDTHHYRYSFDVDWIVGR